MPGRSAPIHLARAEADRGPFAGLETLRSAAGEITENAELVAIDGAILAS